MLITVDTLNFCILDQSCNEVFSMLNLNYSDFEVGRPCQNYSDAYYMQGIKISYSGTTDTIGRVLIEMSGKGCRNYEDLVLLKYDLEWIDFITYLNNFDIQWRRIDIACDDTSGLFTVRDLCYFYEQKRIAGSLRSFKYILGSEETFYAGSPKSDHFYRIYNKKMERGYKPEDMDGLPWVRCESQLRDDKAKQFIQEWIRSQDITSIFCGHLLEDLRFTCSPNNDQHAERLIVCQWWLNFCNNAKRIQFVSKPGSVYNLDKCTKFIFNQAISSIKTYIAALNLTADEVYDLFTSENIHLSIDQINTIVNSNISGIDHHITDDQSIDKNDMQFKYDLLAKLLVKYGVNIE